MTEQKLDLNESMKIGSGDCFRLLAGLTTKTHIELLQRFVSGSSPRYNAKASPVPAFRAGAILEDKFLEFLGEDWYSQLTFFCERLDVLKCTLDFAIVSGGVPIRAKEMKTVQFNDFINIPNTEDERLEYIKKKYKANYNQVQFQLLCCPSLECVEFTQVVVYDATNDGDNLSRVFSDNEIKTTIITRDDAVIDFIRERAMIFQIIKNYYKND